MTFCGCFRKIHPNEKPVDETIQHDRRKQIIKMILFVNKNNDMPTS